MNLRNVLARASIPPFAAVLLALPLLLLWRPLLAGEAFFWGTPLLQFIPWQRLAAEMWRAGHAPLWNPWVGCGAPLAANYQTAAFYPFNLLYLLLPAEVALTWTVAGHLVLTGWGMYRWGRAVGLEQFSALVGALTLEGSGYLLSRATLFPSMILAFAWIPVWLWRAEELVRRQRGRDVLWLGLALGLGLLTGHAQTAFYGGLTLAAYIAWRAWQVGRGQARRRWRMMAIVGWLSVMALALGVGLAAVQLLPTAELMCSSPRAAGVDFDFAMTYSLWPWRLISFFAPDFFGNPGHGDYWGYPNYWEGAGYVGVLPLWLALAFVSGSLRKCERRKRESEWTFWVAVALIGLLLALGKNTPVFPFLFRHVPTFDWFQAPARWLAVVTVALAALAAWGTQAWPVGHRGLRWGLAGILLGMAFLFAGLVAMKLPMIPATFGPATARLGGTLAVAGALMRWRRDTGVWRGAVLTFVLLDLWLFGSALTPTVDQGLYDGVTETARVLRNTSVSAPIRVYWPGDPFHPASEYDAEYRVKFGFLTFDDFGPREAGHWRAMRDTLLPNVAMLDPVAVVNNFDPLTVGWHTDVLAAAVEHRALLRVMGATHVASDRLWPGGAVVHVSRRATVYALPDALGRAWIVPTARRLPPDEALAALTDPAFDPRREVLLVGDSPSVPTTDTTDTADEQAAAGGRGWGLRLRDVPNGVTIDANLDAPGYLVLADTWYPGWWATVDGHPAELLRANYAFRAVWLTAGEHVVEMRYRPPLWMVGAAISGVSGLVYGLGIGVSFLWERRGRRAQ